MQILTQDIELDVGLVCHQTALLPFCRLAAKLREVQLRKYN